MPSLHQTISNEDFYERFVKPIPGWLHDYTALRTLDILDWQTSNGIRGPVFEIGVYAGRYFSLLMFSAQKAGDEAFGLDTFQWVGISDVEKNLASIGPIDKSVHLIKGFSTAYTKADLAPKLKTPPRFISIDGSHEYEDVMWDLRLAEDLISAEGIVAIDDFINPVTLGVNQAVNTFFSTHRNLAPVAYIQNKLFLVRLHRVDTTVRFIEDRICNLTDNRSRLWVKDRDTSRHLTEVKLFGSRTLVVS